MLRACIFSRRRSDAEQRFTLEPGAGPRRTTKVVGFVLSGGVPGLSSGISTGEAHLARRRVVNESFGAPILSRSKSRSGCTRPETLQKSHAKSTKQALLDAEVGRLQRPGQVLTSCRSAPSPCPRRLKVRPTQPSAPSSHLIVTRDAYRGG